MAPFEPLVAGRVGIYVCGPTVQAEPHIGHVRSAVVFDILRRWLLAQGLDVVFVRNVTDIDDKIIHDAGHLGIEWWALAERNTRAFNAAYDAVGVLPPTVEPRATGHLPQMIDLMHMLIEARYAYASGGDVYFNVRALPSYGEISHQDPDNLQVTEKIDPDRPKRDPLDFALWKAHKPGEPSWETPWGRGRPGWHLECSAMAATYLGAEFDIHGGGLDLVFPHHENEAAQSTGAGHAFARTWMHHGMVNVGAEKMSKSLGNSLLVRDLLARCRPQVLRYALGAAHYRSSIDWSDATLVEAGAAYGRLEAFLRNTAVALGSNGPSAPALAAGLAGVAALPKAFVDAMNDDLAVPEALAVVHTSARDGNGALAAGDLEAASARAGEVALMLEVLGLNPAQWPSASADLTPVVDALVAVALEQRAAARERKDWAAADEIRDRVATAGVVVEDTAGGVRWRLDDGAGA